jgi:NADPH-dependent F420 reductase
VLKRAGQPEWFESLTMSGNLNPLTLRRSKGVQVNFQHPAAEGVIVSQRIGVVGGTGPEGKGLAARFARAGLAVYIGSRSAERGDEAAQEIAALTGKAVSGGTNEEAVHGADLVLLAVPYSGLRDTLTGLATHISDQIVVSTVVPLQFSRARVSVLEVPDGSAAEEAQALLPQARVAAAFHNLSAGHLIDIEHPIDGDVVVCGDEAGALQATIELANLIEGVRGVNGGPLANSRFVEDMTALLLNINRIHKAETHFKIVGI